MKKNGRFDKTIVFCVDQEHADEMRRLLNNFNSDLVKDHPNYVCRVTANDGDIGRGHLSKFQELETETPVILTTSQLLSTGVDAPMVKNVALVRVIGSMTEFKQIIGRGTRVRDDYGKLFFNILDYTGSATRHFADPEFDGFPALITEVEIDDEGEEIPGTKTTETPDLQDDPPPTEIPTGQDSLQDDDEGPPRKFYVDGGQVEIAAHIVQELDVDGNQLRVVAYADYAAEKVRMLYPSAAVMRKRWADPEGRAGIIAMLEERGVSFEELAEVTGHPEADPFDLICHIAFNAPLRTRRERAERVRRDKKDFFDKYGPEARNILNELLEKYAEHGATQVVIPDVLEILPISGFGNVVEIAQYFGGAKELRAAMHELQNLLYAA
jgi:type I restriction enzyme R subunit